MFDIGWGELVVIGIVTLVVIGPKELPTVLRTIGQWSAKVRRMAAEFQAQFHEAMREAEFAELKKQVDAIGDTTRELTNVANPLDTVRREIDSAIYAQPSASAPMSSPAEPAAEPPALAPPSESPAASASASETAAGPLALGIAAEAPEASRSPAAPENVNATSLPEPAAKETSSNAAGPPLQDGGRAA